MVGRRLVEAPWDAKGVPLTGYAIMSRIAGYAIMSRIGPLALYTICFVLLEIKWLL